MSYVVKFTAAGFAVYTGSAGIFLLIFEENIPKMKTNDVLGDRQAPNRARGCKTKSTP
jgi:hypothetical protein